MITWRRGLKALEGSVKRSEEEFLEKLYLPLLAWPLIVLQHDHHVVLVVRFAT